MKKLLLLIACCVSGMLSACEPKDKPIEGDEPTRYNKANTYVVYECNERLFAQTNAFQAIEDYVPALRRMQVNVLWLMPIHPRGTVKTVNSPYCVKDYFAVDPAFGTIDDLRSLVKTCHENGMLVILDWVANHTAWDNAWYEQHPEWYTSPVADEVNWKDVVPLNYEQPAVRDAMTEALLYWMREADIDGFRCDYAHGVPADYWAEAIRAIRSVKPNAVMLAETSKVDYYGSGFDWLYSWDYLGAVQKIYSQSLQALYATSEREMSATPEGKQRLRNVTSHDAASENAPSRWFVSAQGELAASCLTFFLEGVPMIYSSQEIGEMGQINFFNYHLLSFPSIKDSASASDNAVFEAYCSLMRAYQLTAEARYGTRTDFSTERVGMFTYSQGEKKALVVVNVSGVNQEVTLPMLWQRYNCIDALTGDSVLTPKVLPLQPYEYKVYMTL